MAPRLLTLLVACGLAGCGRPGVPTQTAASARTQVRTFPSYRGPVVEVPSRPFGGDRFSEHPLDPDGRLPTLAFTPDGKQVVVAAGPTVTAWDVATRKLAGTYPEIGRPGTRLNLGFTADSGRLVTHAGLDDRFRYTALSSGQPTGEWTFPEGPTTLWAFSPRDGRAVVERGGKAVVLDLTARTTVATLDPGGRVLAATFSPDAAAVVFLTAGRGLRRVDVATGAAHQLVADNPAEHRNWPPVFSPDGRLLVWAVAADVARDGGNRRQIVLSAETGEQLCVTRTAGGGGGEAISSDGRVIARHGDSGLRLYDTLTEQDVPGYVSPANCFGVKLSPDGRTLAVIAYSTANPVRQSLYLGPLPTLPPPVRPGAELSPAEIDDWWLGLASENRFRREYAEKLFRDRPEQTTVIAQQRLKPVPDRDRRRLDDLIANLSDPDAEFRNRVAADLAHYTAHFRPRLTAARDALKDGPAKALLTAALAVPDPTAEANARGVAVLAGLNAPAARKLLAELAAGAEGATLTDAARKAAPPDRPK